LGYTRAYYVSARLGAKDCIRAFGAVMGTVYILYLGTLGAVFEVWGIPYGCWEHPLIDGIGNETSYYSCSFIEA